MNKTKRTDKKTATKATARTAGEWQGMNWIRQSKRLAIYLRDGCACAWCGATVEDGAMLTLDHLKPHTNGGSNHESNLVTACRRCNSSRQARTVARFARDVAAYINHGVKAADVESHVRNCAARSLKSHKAEAAALIARRGSAPKALSSL
jgi:5-methylcytosine-specific restriction endonuclease McrA